ncbi:hypothetical protein M9458_051455, partial [Cirrhinus mrigala]
MPRVEQTLASYLSPAAASSLKAPVLALQAAASHFSAGGRPPVPSGGLWLPLWLRRDISVDPVRYEGKGQGLPPGRPAFRLLACSATQSMLSSTGTRRHVSKRRRSSGSSLAAVQLTRLLSWSSLVRVPAPHTGKRKNRASPPRNSSPSEAGRSSLRRAFPSVFFRQKTKTFPELGGSPPLRGSQGPLDQVLPCRAKPLQDTGLATRVTPEASLERLVPLVDHLAAMETTAQCVCLGPAHCRARLSHSVRRSTSAVQRGLFPLWWAPSRVLVMEQEVATLLRKEAIEVVPPQSRESGFYSRYFHCSQEGWGPASYFGNLRLLNRSVLAAEVQDADCKTGRVSNQVRGLVCHDRSKRRVFPRLHPSSTQEVPEGIRILNYIDDWLILAQSEMVAVRHRDVVLRSHEGAGVETERQEKTTYLGRGVGFDHDAGTFVSCSDRVDPHCSQESEGRP